ncbi:MAG TPA: hypothetical protein VMU76_04040 [Acidimicrobiales bacterium]|nr:hypothetical protein [Acidimicrobiales bacterium]
MERVTVRIWVPDRPGVLGAVATRIGGILGNVVGLEVLERAGGVAVDELTVELPDVGLVDGMCRQIQSVEGAGVEDVRSVGPDEEERYLKVMSAALAIFETANSAAALSALMGFAEELFELDWATLCDLPTGTPVHSVGVVPAAPWLAAFAEGTRPDAADGRTDRSGVLAEHLEAAGLSFFVGRPAPFRRRERREVQMLARVADRVWSALQPVPGGRPRW